MQSIRLCVPQVGEDEIAEISKVFASGYLTQGAKTLEFEKIVASYVGTRYAISTTSATTALHLSLAALGISNGDEVLVPDFTFPATANVVIQQGAIPVLVDIDLDTFNIDVNDMKRKMTRKTKAVIPVHLFGLPADMNPIMDIAEKKKLFVIEDAACSLGAAYKRKKCGSIGNVGCFSFHPRKIITTGEGGMITTDDSRLAKKIKILRNHGGERKNGRYIFKEAGFNYRLSDIHSAVGIAQMKKIGIQIEKRKHLATYFNERLSRIDGIKYPLERYNNTFHIFQSYVVLLKSDRHRDRVIKNFASIGIETTLGTYALHTQPYMKKFGYKAGDLPNSFAAYKRSLSLPFYPDMSISIIDRIAEYLSEMKL